MSITTILPCIVKHPGEEEIKSIHLEAASHLVSEAMKIIRYYGGVTAAIKITPLILEVDTPPAETLIKEFGKLRKFQQPNTIMVAFSRDVGSSSFNAGGWGAGSNGRGRAILRHHGLDIYEKILNGEVQYEKLLVFIYMVAHEIAHCMGISHTEVNPRSIPCRYYYLMCYSHSAFVQWASGKASLYKVFTDKEKEELQSRPYLLRIGGSDTYPENVLKEKEELEGIIIVSEIDIIMAGEGIYPKQQSVIRRSRVNGVDDIHQIQIHSTRGPTDTDRQLQATVNWFASIENTQNSSGHSKGWGASADFVVGRESRIDGNPVTIVQFGDWMKTYGSWSAGWGSSYSTQHGAAKYGVAIEVAQRNLNDEFDPEVMTVVADLCRYIDETLKSKGHDGIPTERILSWDQERSTIIPRGYIGHEDLANGVKLGKSDPGPEWDWEDFFNLVSNETENDKIAEVFSLLNKSIVQQTALIEDIAEVRRDLIIIGGRAQAVLDSLIKQKELLESI